MPHGEPDEPLQEPRHRPQAGRADRGGPGAGRGDDVDEPVHPGPHRGRHRRDPPAGSPRGRAHLPGPPPQRAEGQRVQRPVGGAHRSSRAGRRGRRGHRDRGGGLDGGEPPGGRGARARTGRTPRRVRGRLAGLCGLDPGVRRGRRRRPGGRAGEPRRDRDPQPCDGRRRRGLHGRRGCCHRGRAGRRGGCQVVRDPGAGDPRPPLLRAGRPRGHPGGTQHRRTRP